MTRRLVLSYLGVTALVLAVLVVPLGVSNQRRQLQDVRSGLERDAFVLATFVEGGLATGVLDQAVVDRVRAYADDVGSRVVVVGQQGDALLDTDPPVPGDRNFLNRPEVAAALGGGVATGTRRSDTLDQDLVYAAVPVASAGVVDGAVRVTYPTTEVDDRVRRYWLALGGVVVVSLAVVGLLGVVLARSVTKPLRRMEQAARDLGEGDLSVRVPEDSGPPEVRSLSSAFNRTASRLEELVGSQEAFVADASHQLRTPLSGLRLRLENLQSEPGGPPAEELEDAIGETERLARMVDGLLALARADRSSPGATAVRLDAAAVLAERAAAWQPLAEERRIAVGADAPVGLTVSADPDRLVQVLDNYVANAIDVSPDGSTIRLTAERADGRTALHVLDDGPGLTAEERRRAFDRFWRADPAREGLGGSGLGLAIVAKLVHADGGSARLDAADGGGIDAVVELPS